MIINLKITTIYTILILLSLSYQKLIKNLLKQKINNFLSKYNYLFPIKCYQKISA